MSEVRNLKVRLASIDVVKRFVCVAMDSECNVDIFSGKYAIDGKSIMGIFSIDLTGILNVRISSSSKEDVDLLYENIKDIGVIVE